MYENKFLYVQIVIPAISLSQNVQNYFKLFCVLNLNTRYEQIVY
jgi:hypothetical protein